ncbi:MAG: DNA topoisomerase IB [Chloroflexota bacterium]|nr:DNA topoisomerase IB [Chloroflexota bacterium]
MKDPATSAEAAGLRYISDTGPGITRRRAGKHFSYLGLDGAPIRDRAELDRIKGLGIPPAWKDVWICPDPLGHIQATGRDAKGRKQYRYHPRWREIRDETKYGRMMAFGRALPRIRERTNQDLARRGLPREKVLATVVRLLEATLIRVGNEEYARTNESFGLTTMRDDHVDVQDSKIHFHFRGKSGVEHTVDLKDRRLAAVVRRSQDLPGQELFQYIDEDGERQTIDSGDVNEYLREITGEDFTAKDFRTWAGTVLAAQALQEFGEFDSEAHAKRNVVAAIEAVASRLGNTRAISRKSYVHPAIIEGYMDGSMRQTLKERAEEELEDLKDLPPEEAAVLVLLRQRLAREQQDLHKQGAT